MNQALAALCDNGARHFRAGHCKGLLLRVKSEDRLAVKRYMAHTHPDVLYYLSGSDGEDK